MSQSTLYRFLIILFFAAYLTVWQFRWHIFPLDAVAMYARLNLSDTREHVVIMQEHADGSVRPFFPIHPTMWRSARWRIPITRCAGLDLCPELFRAILPSDVVAVEVQTLSWDIDEPCCGTRIRTVRYELP